MQAFEPEIQIESVLGGLDGAQVPHQLGGALGDERACPAEFLGIGDAVIAVVRGAQAGEALGVRHPVEFSGVDDGAAHGCAVAVHILCGGMGHDIGAPFDGPAAYRGGEGVIHDQGHAVPMGGGGKSLDIQHGQRRVRDGLAEYAFGVGAEGGLQLGLRAVRRYEGGLDPHFRHGDGQQVKGAAVDAGGGYDMIAAAGDIEHGIEIRRLAGACQHSGGATLQLGDLCRNVIVRGVLQPCIEIPAGLQIKQLAHILAGSVFEGGGLDDGDLARFAVAGRVAALHADGFGAIVGHDESPLYINAEIIIGSRKMFVKKFRDLRCAEA